MSIKRATQSKAQEYSVSYSGMHGIDLSPDSSLTRSKRYAELENMYRDYDGGGAGITESIPGFRRVASLGDEAVNAIFSYKDKSGEEYIVVHSKNSLYRFPVRSKDSVTNQEPIITINNTKSTAFTSGSDLYILDGAGIIRLNGDGNAAYISDLGECSPYIPTTYLNGEEYEQRNLLTNRFYEKYLAYAASDVSVASEGLTYRIISPKEKTCTVTGIEPGNGGAVYIPTHTYIYGESYKVTEIDDDAFAYNDEITSLFVSDSVTRIGRRAFLRCPALTSVVTLNSLWFIGEKSFSSCPNLTTVYIGAGVYHIEEGAFEVCLNLKSIYYASVLGDFMHDTINTNFSEATIYYERPYGDTRIEIPIFSPTKSIASVKIGDEDIKFDAKIKKSLVAAVIVTANDISMLDGKEFTISGIMSPTHFKTNSVGTNFMSENGIELSGFDAITKCRICESFDGRVFLSGNEALPNTVFYSARDKTGRNNPLYFGILNYFNDGIGSFKVESMLAAGDSLAVFKSGDDGCGSIYYHTPQSTGYDIMPVIYPVTYLHNGIHAVGDSISFFDDPIFLSSLGVSALDKRNINLERSISVRSHNINSKLLSEDLSAVSMARWSGYLVLCIGEHMYLADSRDTFIHHSGSFEYEWYYLSGIGTYKGDRPVYKYSPTAHEGYSVHPNVDKKAVGTAYLANSPEPVIYTVENGIKYEIYPTGEREGGSFYPATVVHATGNDLLFFGTKCGDVCVFNNDKRGEPPRLYENVSDEDREDFRLALGRRLHHSYYSFNGHTPKYQLTTSKDNCGFQNLEKTTVKNSLTSKIRLIGHGEFTCEAATDKKDVTEISRFNEGILNFADIDFSCLSFSGGEYITLPFKEREKGWIEKQISFRSDEYEAPFGICNISYRFKIKGRIKN